MTSHALPQAFCDLEPYLSWALPTERERIAKRVASPMPEIIEFHGALAARLEDIVAHLNQYAYDDLPPEGRRLCDLALSLVEVFPLVEMYKDPANLYMIDPARFVPYE